MRKKYPSNIDVYGQKIKVVFKDLGEETDGEYSPVTKTIYLNKRLKEKELNLTFLHELFHAILNVLGFDERLSDDIEELIVSNLSNWIHDNYKISLK